MRKNIIYLVLILIFILIAGDLSASSSGICRGFGSGRVHVHVNAGRRHNSRGDDLLFLLMVSSTSTSIYCISTADDEDEWSSSQSRRRSRYSYINYDRLKEEGARGRGEYLAALSYYMGCPTTVTGEFGASVQKKYRILFGPSNEFQGDGFLDQLAGMISENPTLRTSCVSALTDTDRF